MAFKLWHVPVRLATGAFILNSGLSKRNADKETAERLHGFASGAYPQFQDTSPEQFAKMLSTGEIVVGAALLTPFVPTGVAGAALTGFAASLGRLYWRSPGMHEEGSLRPTQQGTSPRTHGCSASAPPSSLTHSPTASPGGRGCPSDIAVGELEASTVPTRALSRGRSCDGAPRCARTPPPW